jgi:carbonic anhydrase
MLAVVFGVLFRLKVGEDSSPSWLDKMFDQAPTKYEEEKAYSANRFDMSKLIPSDTAHYEYAGSLVRPLCFAKQGGT